MYWTLYNNENVKLINYQNNDSLEQTQDIFKAFVDAIIPRTPRLAQRYDKVQFFGALDFKTDEFIILSLDNYYIPLAKPTAELLEVAAERLGVVEGQERLLKYSWYMGGTSFVALSPSNRLRMIILLEEGGDCLAALPMPFYEQPQLIQSITSVLNRFTMFGYYSEWFGYGATRLMAPNQRVLEFSPLSWTQVGYPGPTFSYRAEVMDYYKGRKVHE